MSEWKTCKVSDLENANVLKVQDGNHGEYRPRSDEFVEQGTPFIRSADIDNNRILFESAEKINQVALKRIRKGIGEPGDILFSSKGTIGKVAIAPMDCRDFVCSPQVTFWRSLDSKFLDCWFLYYYIHSHHFQQQVRSRCRETDMAPYLSLTNQREFEILVPDIEEQKRIAVILSCLDRKIENLRRQNETLERIAQTLFKHWFVDFEFPNADGKPYKSSGGAMERSELGEIPAGWRVGKLSDVADVKSSKRIFLSEYVESGIPFYRSKEIIELSSGQEISTSLYISEERFREIESKFGAPSAGEILVTSVGTIGVTYIVKSKDKFYFKDGNLTWIRNFRGGFNGAVIYYWLKLDSTRNQIEQNTIGSTQKALTIQALSGLKLILPEPKVLSGYRDLAESIHGKRESNTQQIRTLTKTRDVLLPQLMSGKLRVIAGDH